MQENSFVCLGFTPVYVDFSLSNIAPEIRKKSDQTRNHIWQKYIDQNHGYVDSYTYLIT